jgi:3-ketosteroid 9alpha-monooxygenase subunit A
VHLPQLSTFPRGWFVAAFSSEIPPKGVKSLRYFGEKLVAFRGEDGAVHILDGYCAHMGADLGAGGVVVGDSIQCPFHAWRYCGTGECIDIPYAKKIPPKARQRAWTVREVNGLVFVWHDERGGAPDFEIPAIPDIGSSDWTPWVTSYYPIKTHPREIVENIADRGHFPAVHRTEIDEFEFSIDRHMATQRVKGRAILPGGGVDNFASSTTYHGPGYLVMRMSGVMQNYMVVAHTPVDSGNLELRMGVMLKKITGQNMDRLTGLYMSNLKAGFEDDIRIWENKLYRENPVFCDGDGPIGQLRRWYRQFYAAPEIVAEPKVTGADAGQQTA